MSNYNVEIDLLKVKGARVADVKGNTRVRRCICIPIDNAVGTVTDSYFTRDQVTGERVEVRKKGVSLNLTAFELASKERGQSHLLKPSLSKETYESLTEEQRRMVPWIGNLKPWERPDGAGEDW